MSTDTQVASATAVVEEARRLGLMWRLIPGTVISGENTLTNIYTTVDGDEQELTRTISLIGPVIAGQRVMLLVIPPQERTSLDRTVRTVR